MWPGLMVLWPVITSILSNMRSGEMDLSGGLSFRCIPLSCSFSDCAACFSLVILLRSCEIEASLFFKFCTWAFVVSRSCSLVASRTIVCNIDIFFRISWCCARSCSSSPTGKMFRSEVGRKDDIVAMFFHEANDCWSLLLNSFVPPAHSVWVGVISSSFR